MSNFEETVQDLLSFTNGKKYNTIYADPPWQFQNRTGKVAPEHKRLNRYETMTLEEIKKLPVSEIADEKAHLYLWIPNALLPNGLEVMDAWGFEYKGNIVWEKIRKDGFPDGRGVGFYFRNVTELLLFGIKKKVHLTEHYHRHVRRLILSDRKRENIAESLTKSFPLLNHAVHPLALNCLHEEIAKVGICGEIRLTQNMNPIGRHIKTILLRKTIKFQIKIISLHKILPLAAFEYS